MSLCMSDTQCCWPGVATVTWLICILSCDWHILLSRQPVPMCKKTFEDGEYLVYCTNGIEIDMNFGLMDSNQFKFTDV